LDSAIKLSKLNEGDEVSGKLLQDVYSGTAEAFPAESPVHLTVDHLERRKRVPDDHWPWIVKLFLPRHERYPVFKLARVVSRDGYETLQDISVLSIAREVEIEPKEAAPSSVPARYSSHARRCELGPIVTMAARIRNGNADSAVLASGPEPVIVPPGTIAKVILLRDVSASKDHPGDSFQARLIEPVRLNSRIVLPEGILLDGKVLHSRAPRTLSRSASLYLSFTNLSFPGAGSSRIAASVAGADVNQRSHTVIDPEGQMRGDRPGKVWMLVNLGVTGGVAKEADDGAQLLIEGLVSTATDASTAGTARIASTLASGVFLLTRHGRDVVLPKYTQLKIVFDRPLDIPQRTVTSSLEY
jgi:hypothetical protein